MFSPAIGTSSCRGEEVSLEPPLPLATGYAAAGEF